MVSRIQPCKAASQCFYLQSAAGKIFIVDACDLDLTTGRRFYICRDLHNIIIIEIQTRNRIIALWLIRLFLDGKCLAVFIKFYNAVFSRISDIIAKDRSTLFLLYALGNISEHAGKALSVENIVTKHKRNAVVSDKIRPDSKTQVGILKTAALVKAGKL